MNLIWNKNIQLFEKRFPQLCELIADHISFFKKFAGTDDEINLYPFWKISESKIHTPIAEENGLRLHSAYNPIRESDSFITSQSDKISEKDTITEDENRESDTTVTEDSAEEDTGQTQEDTITEKEIREETDRIVIKP